MPFKNSPKIAKKDSAEAGTKAPDRKKPMQKKKSGGGHDDDNDSVDSRGNVRGLIAYSDEEDEALLSSDDESYDTADDTPSDATDLTPEQRKEVRRSARRAAMKARKRIQKSAAATAPKAAAAAPAPSPKRRAEPEPVRRKAPVVKKRVIESESEEEEEEKPRKSRGFAPRRKKRVVEEEEDEDEDEEDEEEDDEGSEADEDDEDDEEYEEGEEGAPNLFISFGAGGEGGEDRMIPKRHNMKKESDDVKKFVKLVTKPHADGGIDDQIDEFKRLAPEKQKELLTTLDRKPGADPNTQSMMFKILGMKLDVETQSMVLAKYNALQTMDPGAGEYYKQRAWLEKFASLPLGIYKDIPVRLSDGSDSCGAFMERARRCLNEAIYGQDEAKIQILQFIASKIANPDARGLSLLLAGPPGIGKTSLIKNGIAKALGWPFQFISLGGDSDASTYVGHQVVYEGSHCGKIVNSIVAAKSMSMILMFDELDKISATPKGEEVQNLLVHLTDPVQNGEFEDKYLSGIPLDLSKVLFTFSANDLDKIDRVLMDRMVVIQLAGYTSKEKLSIATEFLLPSALKEVALDEKVAIAPDVLEHILKEYASEEKGVRELKRCLEAVVQKINMLRIFNTKELPFHIPEFQLPFVVKKQHVDLFLKKKKSEMDVSALRMYS
jgi:DNA polymerase III delta prime subunit